MHPDHQSQLTALNRIQGQLSGVKQMILDRRYCVDILTQTKAVTQAIKSVELAILKTHIMHCLRDAFASQDPQTAIEKIEEVMAVLKKRL